MAAKKAKASTQEHLDIEDILDDLVLLKTGWVALVMSTTAVNFDLLSEVEQDATIYAYGAFLNSLSFPLEVLVRSKKADITSYFQNLEEAEAAQPNPDLKRQMQKYKDFIQSTVQQRTVLDKKFYLIINFSPMEMGLKGLNSKKTTQGKSKAELLIEAKTALTPKRDHVIKQTSRLGLNTKQLTTQELIELFYDIYNPAPTGTQRVLLDTQSYTTPIVEPALEVPTPAPIQPTNPITQLPNNPPDLRPVAPQPVTQGTSIPQVQIDQLPPNNPITQLPNNPLQPPAPQEPPMQMRPAPPNPQPINPQAQALMNLQAATQRASQIINNQPPIPPTLPGEENKQ